MKKLRLVRLRRVEIVEDTLFAQDSLMAVEVRPVPKIGDTHSL